MEIWQQTIPLFPLAGKKFEYEKVAVKAILDFVVPFVLPAIERYNTEPEDKVDIADL